MDLKSNIASDYSSSVSFKCLKSCMTDTELSSLRTVKSKKIMPKKAFLVVEEEDYPETFSGPILASSNRKL